MFTVARKVVRLLPYALQQRRTIAAIVVLSFLVGAVGALQPLPLKWLVDHGLGTQPVGEPLAAVLRSLGWLPGPVAWIAAAAVAGLVVFAVHAAIDAAVTLAWARAGQRMVYDLAGDVFLQLQRLSLSFHADRTVGDSLSRVTGDAWCVYTAIDSLFVAPARHLTVIVSVGLLAWQMDSGLTQLMLVGVPLLAVSAVHFGALLKAAERRTREAGAVLSAFVHQSLGAIPLVQAYTAAARNREIYDRLAGDSLRASRAGALIANTYAGLNGVGTTLAVALVLYAGGLRVLAQTMTLGSLLVFIAYVRALDQATRALLRSYGALRSVEASLDRVFDVLLSPPVVRDAPDACELPPRAEGPIGHLVFERVTVGYEPGRPVLNDLTLEVRPGETLALVGASGVGKSTLASLVVRYFDPWAGRVLLDGVDVRRLRLRGLRAELAMVLQDAFILPLTVAENIAYGKPGATRDEVVAAAMAANAHGFIVELAQGYDTVLAEQGASLSGGQRQRIAIARAALRDPRVLILDEPTSALDAQTEHQVMTALARLQRGRTTLIIAHRLATIRAADRIAVIDGGKVVETGSHAELLAAGGRYAAMVATGQDLSAASRAGAAE